MVVTIVDLSARTNTGHLDSVSVVADHVVSIEDTSGSYWRSSVVTLTGGAKVRCSLSKHDVEQRIREAATCGNHDDHPFLLA